jgi:hypothetical protein
MFSRVPETIHTKPGKCNWSVGAHSYGNGNR